MDWPCRYDLLLRFRLIEIVALWEGALSTNHLCHYFGIKRQQASKDINMYLNEIAPNNLKYDSSVKRYQPTVNFKPVFTQGVADEYLHLLERNNDLNKSFEKLELGFGHAHRIPKPERYINPSILRVVVEACHKNLRLEVDYRSIRDPQPDGRVIAPHSIVYSGSRWHVRAYCEKNQEFRDFVLTRFFNIPIIEEGKSELAEQDDSDWNTMVNIHIEPDKRLNADQRQVIEHDYGMRDGSILITVRAPLVTYFLKSLRIDINTIDADPCAQQIIISNLSAIKKWVFK
jgi:predicted DNA-binding transcriptional regulator YafY